MPEREIPLKQRLLLHAPHAIPDLRLFSRTVLAVKIGGRTVRAGIAGQADLYGIFRGGLHIELELKSDHGRLSPEQRLWREWCIGWGVPYLLLQAKPAETDDEVISRWTREILKAVDTLRAPR